MSMRKVEEEAANWTKAISGLTITKNGLVYSINESLKNFLRSFSQQQQIHLSEFIDNTQNSFLEFKTRKGKVGGSWKIAEGRCKTGVCQTILDLLLDKHVNKSKRIVWSPSVNTSELYNRNKTKVKADFSDQICSVCGEMGCPYERNRRENAMEIKLQEEVDKYYWQIANMYMFHGKETNNFPNTGPEDTDVALIFKLMKNCKLFSLDEGDEDNTIYDDLLEVRNLLMHSADNRLSDEAYEECFERMKSILKANLFSSEQSRNAITELEKLKDMRIIMASLTSEQLKIVKEAFQLQQSSLKFDITFNGSLKNDHVLQGILNVSKANSMKYKGHTTQPTPKKSSSKDDMAMHLKENIRTLGGAVAGAAAGAGVGAAAGSVAGPPGAVVGAAIGWLIGKFWE